jgi:L-ascorbate metabolism protein UlaG (beta-lactamase superfamily)
MHISWLGTTAIKIQTKPFDKDVTILIDPYKPTKGSFPRSLSGDIALYTRENKESITVSGTPSILDTTGEVEIKGVLVTAIRGTNPGETLLRIDAEKMSIGHIGLQESELTDKHLEMLSGVDILFLPVGDMHCFGARSAIKAIQAIEPRVVIPMAYKSDNDPDAKELDGFIKELGVQPQEEDKKVIIKKKDLPQEEMKVIVISKE